MSSNYITPLQTQEAARLQGSQQVSRAPEPLKAKPLAELPELIGNDSAASGENLPLESAVSKISDFIQNFQRDLVFTIDEESDRLVVKVVDSATQEVIRQIPGEETLSIARNLDSSESLIISKQA